MAHRPRKPRPHGVFLTVAFSGSTPTTADKNAWLETAHRQFVRVLRAKYPGLRADDIAASEVLWAAERIDRLIVAWSVARYVRQRVNGGRALLDWQRSQRVQRCEGARGTRTTLSIEAPLPSNKGDHDAGSTIVDVLAARQEAVEDSVSAGLLDVVLGSLSERDQHIVQRVAIDRWQVTEVAAELGLARETVSRRYNAAIAALRDQFGEQLAAYFGDDDIQPPC